MATRPPAAKKTTAAKPKAPAVQKPAPAPQAPSPAQAPAPHASAPRPAQAARGTIDSFDHWLNTSLDKLANGDLRETQMPPRVFTQRELDLAERLLAVREYMADYGDRIDAVSRGEYDAAWQLRNRYDGIGQSLQRVMKQLDEMTRVCQLVATGDTDAKVAVKGMDDKLGMAVNTMVDSLRDAAGQADTLAKGDFRADIRAKGPKDRLGIALGDMTRMLRDVATFAKTLATGDVSQRLTLRGDNDLMGLALQALGDTLRDASEQLDVVGTGNYLAEVQPRGPQDRLGHAMAKTTRLLREVGTLMESVALCNVNLKIELKGEKDLLGRSVNRVIDTLRETAERARLLGEGDFTVDVAARSADDALGLAMQKMGARLREFNAETEARQWLGLAQNELTEQMRGELDYKTLGNRVLDVIVKRLDAQVAVFYVPSGPKTLQMVASYAYTHRRDGSTDYAMDRGLLGQALVERKVMVIDQVPPNYMPVGSALGETAPRQLMLVPLVYQGEAYGIIELASLSPFGQQHLQLVESMRESIALTLSMAKSRERMNELLAESQAQGEELQTQQEELRASNEEMEEQTKALKKSEETLLQQSEELRATNEELEEKTEFLERQRQDIAQQNGMLEQTRQSVEEKARQLEITSRYKSEFLANMSHELRTPLNSMLLLSRSLEDNDEANLTADQIESVRVIHAGGKDLLNLINEILDLSKVEAGKMVATNESVVLDTLLARMSE